MVLEGQIKNIIYHNDENGFSIFIIKEKNRNTLSTVTGSCFNLFKGEHVICEGNWVKHKVHQEQFEAKKIDFKEPDDLENIYIYLTSGLLKGIGDSIAKKLINAYGVEVFNILDNTPEKILMINGIGEKIYEKIIISWEEKRFAPKVINELLKNNININTAYKIYKFYGMETLDVLNKNPYEIIKNIPEVSFFLIDNIALKKGFKKDNPIRIISGLIHLLREEQYKNGSVAIYEKELLDACFIFFKKQINKDYISLIIESGIKLEHFTRYKKNDDFVIQLLRNHLIEELISDNLYHLSKNKGINIDSAHLEEIITFVEKNEKITLTEEQFLAVKNSVLNKINIISGGPGVGKTTVLNVIIKVLNVLNISNIKLCAPTGRAAKKITETTGHLASTIHRLLEFNPKEGFIRNELNKLEVDYLIIDESSMIDMYLFYNLLKALPKKCHLLIVGDKDQLLSVEAGSVLKDLIFSQVIYTSFLNKIHRQAEDSKIITNAHLVNNGKNIIYDNDRNKDFFFIQTSNERKTIEYLKLLLSERLEKAFGFNPKKEVQVLTIKHEGIVGTKSLNKEIQEILNPKNNRKEITKGNNTFRVNDNIMQIKNNYDKFIFNGDMGVILDFNNNELLSVFNEEEVVHEMKELDQITLSYAKTIYKSQGSEYPCVVLIVPHEYSRLLDRSNYYTGITRGKKMVIVLGSKSNFEKAITNNTSINRITCLKEKIKERFNKT